MKAESEEMPRLEGIETFFKTVVGTTDTTSEEMPRLEGIETEEVHDARYRVLGPKKCPDWRGLRHSRPPCSRALAVVRRNAPTGGD